jgi:hypothetical protein
MEKHSNSTRQFFRVSDEWVKIIHENKNFLNCYSELMSILNKTENLKSDDADKFLRKICNSNIFLNKNETKNENLFPGPFATQLGF